MRIRQATDDDIVACLPDGVEAPYAGPPSYLEDDQWRWLMELGCDSQGRCTAASQGRKRYATNK